VARAGQRKRTDYTGLIILALVAPVYVLFIYLGKEELGRSVAIVLGMTMIAVRVRWGLRRRLWFWAIIVSLLALHFPLLFLFRWPHGYHGWLPAVGTLPIGLADVLIILGAVHLVEKFIVKPRPAGGT
jgi:hypothetical protein